MLKKTWQPSAVQKQKLQPLSKQRILILGAGREGLATYLMPGGPTKSKGI